MRQATVMRRSSIELCTERAVTVILGVYNRFIIDYVPGTGFRKFNGRWADGIWHRTGNAMDPLAEDIRRFKTDVMSAAAVEPHIGTYVSMHTILRQ